MAIAAAIRGRGDRALLGELGQGRAHLTQVHRLFGSGGRTLGVPQQLGDLASSLRSFTPAGT